ncbi:MAG: VCBS repeat-containing protein [Bacteroidota bacterium]|nr:VCBS repeat-containing protein [Bacteroidota bacterium]
MKSNLTRIFLMLLTCFWLMQKPMKAQQHTFHDLEGVVRLQFQNPGLPVDLGVGLWPYPLPMDYDQDGDMDLVVSSGGFPYNGLYFFENTSGDKFPVFKAPVRIGDHAKNIHVSLVGKEPKVLGPGIEYLNFRNKQLSDPVGIFPANEIFAFVKSMRSSQWKYVDFDNDGDQDLIVGLDDWEDYGWDNAYDNSGRWTRGPLHGYVFLIENVNGNYRLKGKLDAAGKPIDVFGQPSPNMCDFDGDGDLDLICGDFTDKFTWFENVGTREKPEFAKGRLLENGNGLIHMNVEMEVPNAVDWDGDGDMDLVVGDEDGRVALIENTGKVKDHMPVFKSPVYFQQEAADLKFGALVTPVSVDWDGDGDQDLLCGNTAGQIGFIENLDGGNPPKWNRPVLLEVDGKPIRFMAGKNGSIQGPAEQKWGYTTFSVADWDGDGLKDIVVNSIWGKVEWFKNIGTKTHPKLAAKQPVKVDWEGKTPPKPAWNWWNPGKNELATQWRTTPLVIDWNKDGLADLVMLDQEGYLAFYERFRKNGELMLHPGKRIFEEEDSSGKTKLLRMNAREAGHSGRRKLCLVDWDNDGDIDLLANSENATWYENVGEKDGQVIFRNRGNLMKIKLTGHDTSPTVVDWNHDGIPELLLGAEDGHFYYQPHR